MGRVETSGDVFVWAPLFAFWVLLYLITTQQLCASSVHDYPKVHYRVLVNIVSFLELLIAIFHLCAVTDSSNLSWNVFTRVSIALTSMMNGFVAYIFSTSSLRSIFRSQELEEPAWVSLFLSLILVFNTFGVLFGWFVAFVVGNTLPIFIYWIFADIAIFLATALIAYVIWPVLEHVGGIIATAEQNIRLRTENGTNNASSNHESALRIGRNNSAHGSEPPESVESQNRTLNKLKRARLQLQVIEGFLIGVTCLSMFITVNHFLNEKRKSHVNDSPYPNNTSWIGHFFYSMFIQMIFISWVFHNNDGKMSMPKDSVFHMCCVPIPDDEDETAEKTSRIDLLKDTLSVMGSSVKGQELPDKPASQRRKQNDMDETLNAASLMVSQTPANQGGNESLSLDGMSDDEVDSQGVASGNGVLSRPTESALDGIVPPPEKQEWQKSEATSVSSVRVVVMEFDGVLCCDSYSLFQLEPQLVINSPSVELYPFFGGVSHVTNLHRFFEAMRQSPRMDLEEEMTFYLVCPYQSNYIRMLLKKIDLYRYFGESRVVGCDGDIYKESEGNVNRMVMQIIAQLDVEHERVLYIGSNQGTIEHFKKLGACNAYQCSIEDGLTQEATKHLTRKYFSGPTARLSAIPSS